MMRTSNVQDARSYLHHLSTDEYFVVRVHLEVQYRGTTHELALTHLEVERRPAAHGYEPCAQVRAGGAGGRILENRRAVREEETTENLLRPDRGEHIGLPLPIDTLEPLESLGARAHSSHGGLAGERDDELLAPGLDPQRLETDVGGLEP